MTGSLSAPRNEHTATLLPSGKVLVAGGDTSGSSGTLASAELYDPAKGTWRNTGSMASARHAHAALLLPNGKVLVAGGLDTAGSVLRSAELYDPATQVWSTTGSLVTARAYHTATLLPNGKVLVAGGPTGLFVNAELYDPMTGNWSGTDSLATSRRYHTATLLPNGKVLVAGGFDLSNHDLVSSELYDPSTGLWSATGDLITARGFHTATLLPNGKVLVAAGNNTSGSTGTLFSAELYDPATGVWSATGSLAKARYIHTATLLPSARVLVAGGANTAFGIVSSAELYDPATGTWAFTGSLVAARAEHTATLLPSGNVLVAGGQTTDTTVELYDSGAELLNISTRLRVLTGDNALIGGFIISGTDSKKVIIRGIGPSLSVSGALADPVLELHKPDGSVVTNDNWKDTQQAEIVGTGIPPLNDLESAIVAWLAPGPYTAILQGKSGARGVALVEVYDLAQSAKSRLANISTRGFVDTGDNVMIGGFIIGPTIPVSFRTIVRVIGPSLPLGGTLQDPTLELRNNSGTLIAFNDNWKDTQQTEIQATGIPPMDDRESAILFTFAPGNYTAIARGRDNTTGVGLVEVYNLP